MLKRLESLAKQGIIRPLDYQFAKFISLHATKANQNLTTLVAALVSFELGKGHICLILSQLNCRQLFGLSAAKSALLLDGVESDKGDLPVIEQWVNTLLSESFLSDGSQATPLVIDGDRLYLHRYWDFEKRVANQLRKLAQTIDVEAKTHKVLDDLFAPSYHYLFNALQLLATKPKTETNQQVMRQQLVCDMLDVVATDELDWSAIDTLLTEAVRFDELQPLDQLVPTSACLNWQKVAAAVALSRRFSVISGGPGTGKTTTVTKLLAALITESQQPLTIKLVAPTGKAAARLTESIGQAVTSLAVAPDIKAMIPTESSTLHRLLGYVPNQVEFRHHRNNPLHLDVLVVDEASMIDLPMMARLLDALPDHARVILLGDKDQLASVEAGAVLGDICSFIDRGYSAQQAQKLSQLTGYSLPQGRGSNGISDSLCMLQKSYRFDARSGIGQLAKAINVGNAYQVESVWKSGFSDIHFHEFTDHNYQAMITMVVNEYRSYLGHITDNSDAKTVLKAFATSRLLCAVREGDFGVIGLNQRIEKALMQQHLIQTSVDELWYIGRPIMISQNDHGLGLYNGDVGIAMQDDNAKLRVYFEMADGKVRGVLPSQLPNHETVFAMTIHKSQGSEFEQTILVLPKTYSPILNRELIYTGVTRAKKRLDLYGSQAVVSRAVQVKTERASGLPHLLL